MFHRCGVSRGGCSFDPVLTVMLPSASLRKSHRVPPVMTKTRKLPAGVRLVVTKARKLTVGIRSVMTKAEAACRHTAGRDQSGSCLPVYGGRDQSAEAACRRTAARDKKRGS
jgi:hypothetical protein